MRSAPRISTIVVPNQLYSFHYSQIPGFEQIYKLSRQHSYAPAGFDAQCYQKLAPEHPLFARRKTLSRRPDEEAILRREYELSRSKGDRSTAIATHNVETSHTRRVLESLKPYGGDRQSAPFNGNLRRRDVNHRMGSGYVKLDDRKSRMPELIAAVSSFFGTACRCQGDYWYPRGGFRDWHTNKYDASGWRLYIVDVDEPEKSYFRIKHPQTDEIVTLWDRPGTFNFFLIDPNRLLWHCIGAEDCNRWSKGFVIPQTWLET
ncbi:MAG: hypothetical protein AAFX40_16925, partial [Cyanobacteria bacterium J06639_1]